MALYPEEMIDFTRSFMCGSTMTSTVSKISHDGGEADTKIASMELKFQHKSLGRERFTPD
jgi:hypothetical protein